MPDQTVDVSGDEERGVNEAPVPGRAVLRRGQELFLYAWVFSLLGTWWELALEHSVRALTTGDPWSSPVGGWSFVQFAEPYGLGAVAVILVVVPLKERGLSAPLVFLLGAAITAAIEAACAAILVLTVGSNPFWDYSAYPSSLGGFTSLTSALVFGTFATLYAYLGHPAATRLLDRASERVIMIASWAALLLYLLALAAKLTTLGWIG